MNADKIHDFMVSKQLEWSDRLKALDEEERALELRKLAINKERENIRMESYIYENFDETPLLSITTTTTITTTVGGRMPNGTRMALEDHIRRIFEKKGTGMGPKELLEELQRANYRWSDYQKGYRFIMSMDCIEKVGRGYLQYRRTSLYGKVTRNKI